MKKHEHLPNLLKLSSQVKESGFIPVKLPFLSKLRFFYLFLLRNLMVIREKPRFTDKFKELKKLC